VCGFGNRASEEASGCWRRIYKVREGGDVWNPT